MPSRAQHRASAAWVRAASERVSNGCFPRGERPSPRDPRGQPASLGRRSRHANTSFETAGVSNTLFFDFFRTARAQMSLPLVASRESSRSSQVDVEQLQLQQQLERLRTDFAYNLSLLRERDAELERLDVESASQRREIEERDAKVAALERELEAREEDSRHQASRAAAAEAANAAADAANAAAAAESECRIRELLLQTERQSVDVGRLTAEVGALERQKHTLEQSVARAESYLAQQTQALTADQGI